MFKDPYIGEKSKKLSKKVLILGESHHPNDINDKNYTTLGVMNNFRKNPNDPSYKFFHKIAKSFGIDFVDINEEFELFWDYVCFGNYIPVPCGIQDSRAKNFLKQNDNQNDKQIDNRKKCNNSLFEFINENDIDYVFVFSRLTYNNMPSLSREYKKEENLNNADNGDLTVGKCRDYIAHCKYLANVEHKNVDVILNKDLIVYGLRHPSARGGYKTENYSDILGKIFEELKNDLRNI